MDDSSHRLFAQRQHRVLGLHLAIQCWINGLDAVALERKHFCSYLSLERVKRVRVAQFREDIEPWFPYSKAFFTKPDSFRSIVLSRRDLASTLPTGTMSTLERVKRANTAGFAIQLVAKLTTWDADLAESAIVSHVALVAAGLAAPTRGDQPRNVVFIPKAIPTREEVLQRIKQRLKNLDTQKTQK